jgi:hypothetical protein
MFFRKWKRNETSMNFRYLFHPFSKNHWIYNQKNSKTWQRCKILHWKEDAWCCGQYFFREKFRNSVYYLQFYVRLGPESPLDER